MGTGVEVGWKVISELLYLGCAVCEICPLYINKQHFEDVLFKAHPST